jgi:hypothetical protein
MRVKINLNRYDFNGNIIINNGEVFNVTIVKGRHNTDVYEVYGGEKDGYLLNIDECTIINEEYQAISEMANWMHPQTEERKNLIKERIENAKDRYKKRNQNT